MSEVMITDPAYLKLIKSMKRPIVGLTKYLIIGTDYNFQTLSIINRTDVIDEPDYYGTVKELEKGVDDDFPFPRDIIRDRFNSMLNNIDLSKKHLTIDFGEIGDEYKFSTAARGKVADGMSFVEMDNGLLTSVFSSLHPLNKTDKVECNMYEYWNVYGDQVYMDPDSYLLEFIIDKKKLKIQEYIRYLRLK